MTRFPAAPRGRIAGPYDLFGATRAVLALVKNVARRMRNRRAVMQLLDWDEHALRDIGLTRADVRLSLGLSWDEDPSMRLNDWASERREAKLARYADPHDGPAGGRHLRLVSGRNRSTSDSISRK
jgi:uncharacterized protein YjiS (DUF1127 family)